MIHLRLRVIHACLKETHLSPRTWIWLQVRLDPRNVGMWAMEEEPHCTKRFAMTVVEGAEGETPPWRPALNVFEWPKSIRISMKFRVRIKVFTPKRGVLAHFPGVSRPPTEDQPDFWRGASRSALAGALPAEPRHHGDGALGHLGHAPERHGGDVRGTALGAGAEWSSSSRFRVSSCAFRGFSRVFCSFLFFIVLVPFMRSCSRSCGVSGFFCEVQMKRDHPLVDGRGNVVQAFT